MFVKTDKQRQAIDLLGEKAKHVMLYGGSRSGKTAILIYALIVRASKVPSRHVILRDKFNHVKTSIWLDTFPKILRLAFPNLRPEPVKSDFYYKFANGSEVWCAGLDDSIRVEKILGKEYSTIYFNECSQIDYASIQVALTRLAEKNDLAKKVYYDENPPSKRHWSYWQFIKKLDPESSEPLKMPDNYACMVINPRDNLANIDPEYISEILEGLPEKQKQRFLSGEFTDDDDGQAYYEFKREHHVQNIERCDGTIFIGMDFNVMPMTAVVCSMVNNKFHIFDEVWLENSDTFKMSSELIRRGYGGASIIPDSTGANRKTSGISDHQILRDNGFTIMPTRNPLVFDRVNNINKLLKDDRIIISPKCRHLIGDLEKVAWKDNELDKKVDPMLTHISDALGYLCWKIDPLRPIMKSTAYNL